MSEGHSKTWLGAQPIKEPGARGVQEVGQALCSRLSRVFEWGVFAGFCATRERGISRGAVQSPSSLHQSVVAGAYWVEGLATGVVQKVGREATVRLTPRKDEGYRIRPGSLPAARSPGVTRGRMRWSVLRVSAAGAPSVMPTNVNTASCELTIRLRRRGWCG